MNSLLVWVLVSWTYVHGGAGIQYSPPVKSLEDCQRLQTFVITTTRHTAAQCIQVAVSNAK